MSRVHTSRALIPRLSKDNNELEIWTTCGADDQFSSPKQIRWSAALGKLLVANSTIGNQRISIRNADLSYHSQLTMAVSWGHYAADSDSSNIYIISGTSTFKRTLSGNAVSSVAIASGRMIDASGDPDYVYVTSNNAADGHGIRMVEKSTMTVVASILATGTGDSQFTDPLGLFYVAATHKLYVAEATRICVITVDDTDGAESLTWDTSYAISGIKDLFFDGTNWFTISATTLTRWDNVFTDATKVTKAVVGYSITDCQNGTLALVDNANSHLALYSKSGAMDQVGSDVGSSGDGSASLFDPVVTGPAGVWYMDDGATFAVASDANISWNSFSGYTWKSAGPHRAIFRATGGLAAVTGIDCNTDLVTSMKILRRLTKCTSIIAHTNAGLKMDIVDLPSGLTVASFYSDPLLTGDIVDLPSGLKVASFYSDPLLTGDIVDLPSGLTVAYFSSDPLLTGDIVDLPSGLKVASFSSDPLLTGDIVDLPSGLTFASFYSDPLLTAGSVAHLTAIQDLRIYSTGWIAADVDTVLLSISDAIHADVAHFAYATPILQIGGTNQAPGGTAAAATTSPLVTPGSGNTDSDWLWDAGAGKHKALTGMAAIYIMRNNTGHVWTVTATGVA